MCHDATSRSAYNRGDSYEEKINVSNKKEKAFRTYQSADKIRPSS